ncbi:mitochondrial 54S ribosomal protein mL54 [Limtongia smithiae]|uniref:mitochondrial 54S ribosomal protein mL54 n=1 Tax=Limtongia smithiae TaxID=1125753 RepID=UPI0034CF903E
MFRATSSGLSKQFYAAGATRSCANVGRRAFTVSSAFSEAETTRRVQSYVVKGTKLKGCNVLKNQEDPEALADEDYPDWLWEILDKDAQQRKLDADPERKAKKEWRAKMRQKIKTSNFLKSMK